MRGLEGAESHRQPEAEGRGQHGAVTAADAAGQVDGDARPRALAQPPQLGDIGGSERPVETDAEQCIDEAGGGRGSAIGAIFGAFAFLTIKDLMFVLNLDPLWQPLLQGVVLLIAVSIGSARLFQVRNRLELFG